jgi:hypothetical protein
VCLALAAAVAAACGHTEQVSPSDPSQRAGRSSPSAGADASDPGATGASESAAAPAPPPEQKTSAAGHASSAHCLTDTAAAGGATSVRFVARKARGGRQPQPCGWTEELVVEIPSQKVKRVICASSGCSPFTFDSDKIAVNEARFSCESDTINEKGKVVVTDDVLDIQFEENPDCDQTGATGSGGGACVTPRPPAHDEIPLPCGKAVEIRAAGHVFQG